MLTAWAKPFAPLTFLTISSLVVGALTFVVWIAQGRKKILPAPGPRGWTIAGGVIVAGQAIMIGVALAFFNDATGINVVYASRGLWAIVLIYWFGKLLGNDERTTSGKHFGWRFLGTTLLTAAVVMAVIERSNG